MSDSTDVREETNHGLSIGTMNFDHRWPLTLPVHEFKVIKIWYICGDSCILFGYCFWDIFVDIFELTPLNTVL